MAASRPQLCRNFLSPAGCRFGDRCHFSHEVDNAAPPPPPPVNTPVVQSSSPTGNRRSGPVCRHYFSPGGCRNGASCRYSHDQPGAASGPPAPDLTPEQEALLLAVESRRVPAFALDVECVATGYTHLDRSVAQIGVVDLDLRPVLNSFVKPTKPVVSYLSPLTGITKDVVDHHGVPLDKAISDLRRVLPKDAVIVGQNISQDATWLNISAPNDYASLLDIAALFRVFDPIRNKWTYFAQDHVASVWLAQIRPPGMHHDALGDAATSMLLLHAYLNMRRDPNTLNLLKSRTLHTPRAPSFAVLHPVYEGVCQGNRRLCQCGAAHFS